jgi:rare lipoprotein A
MKSRLFVVLVMALAAGCATTPRGGYYQDDGPQAHPPADLSRVQDAVPRNEPLSSRGNDPYSVFGVSYHPLRSAAGYHERGVASWYGKKFHGRHTSNGETYDMNSMTAAHKTLPLPSYARVTNLSNGRSVIVRINDRGPFLQNRLIDLSYAAAWKLGILGTGTGIVEVDGLTGDEPVMTAAQQPAARAPASKAGAPRLYLQVGAFTSRDNAENLRDRLARADLAPVYIQTSQLDNMPLYRVRLGPIASVDESDRLAARVAAQGLPQPIVVVEQ